MTFPEATEKVLAGDKTTPIYRKAWDADQYIRLYINFKKHPELVNFHNPTIFEVDLCANDWEIVE